MSGFTCFLFQTTITAFLHIRSRPNLVNLRRQKKPVLGSCHTNPLLVCQFHMKLL